MLRLTLMLALVAGFCLLLADPQNAVAQKGGNNGTLTKINTKTGAITINMYVVAKKKRELTDKEYFLNDDARVVINEGKETKTMTGKEAIAAGALKEGDMVSFTPDGDLKIKELIVGVSKKK